MTVPEGSRYSTPSMKRTARRKENAVRSMTGFGRGERQSGGIHVVADLRSVNHRYLDLKMRLPAEGVPLESDLRRVVGRYVGRGRLDLSLRITRENGRPAVAVDEELLRGYLKAAGSVQRRLGVPGTVDLSALLQVPGGVRIEGRRKDLSRAESTLVLGAAEDALQALRGMREREGAALKRDLVRRLKTIRRHLNTIRRRADGMSRRVAERLRARIRKLAAGVELDPGRLAQEVAYQADRADVTEEMVRLDAHLDAVERLLESPKGPVGRELDFLAQELQRETNTIHSKADDLAIGQATLAIKSEIEKIREQVQNVE